MNPPERPRAVFSIDDFRIIRDALAHYLKVVPDGPDATRCASLYHRLGRIEEASAPRPAPDAQP